MVSIDPESRKQRGGITIPFKCFVPLALLVVWMSIMQVKNFIKKRYEAGEVVRQSSYYESKPILRNPDQHREQCKLYLAESIMAKNAGLGIFTGIGLLKDEDVGFPDICIFIGDAPKERTHIRSHTFGFASFFGVSKASTASHPTQKNKKLTGLTFLASTCSNMKDAILERHVKELPLFSIPMV